MALNQDQDRAGIVAGTTNGPTFFKEIQVECNGITVYNNTRANESSNISSLLKYTKEYADAITKDNFLYLDTSTGTAEPRSAQALYNQGYALRKILTDAPNETKYPFH